MKANPPPRGEKVHCRVGSLESMKGRAGALLVVHCRVGSLEMMLREGRNPAEVHCRVGSLESIGTRRW